MRLLLITVMLALASASATATSSKPKRKNCDLIICKGSDCGCELLKKGWKEMARCPGHRWSYVIQKNDLRKICFGVDARGGSQEEPCREFTGELSEFKSCGPHFQ